MLKVLSCALLMLLASASLSFAQRSIPRLPQGVKLHADKAYVENGHERQKLDLYLPEDVKTPLPTIIWIHGGAWQGGDKRGGPALGYVKQGYAVASINYRYSQQAIYPAQIQDCQTAVRWLRSHAKEYNLDPERFGVWGASAGGHLVALLGTASDAKEFTGKEGASDVSARVQCVVDWFGPTDLVKLGGGRDRGNSPISKLLGGSSQDRLELAKSADPINYVSQDDPPFLIMHGDKDTLVPVNQSELLTESLKAAGVEVTLKVLPGAGHGGGEFTSAESSLAISDFFAKHLKK